MIDQIISSNSSMLVAVTRHPMARFASAWAQKFRKNGEFDKEVPLFYKVKTIKSEYCILLYFVYCEKTDIRRFYCW